MDSSRKILAPEEKSVGEAKQIQADIFARLPELDLADHAAVIQYVQDASAEIQQNGYEGGRGDRTLLKKMIAAEEKNGVELTRASIVSLECAVDIFERYENTLPPGEHEKCDFLVGAYGALAASLLDMRDDLDEAYRINMTVCQLYSADENYVLDLFSQSLSQYMADVHLSQYSSLEEKIELLKDLACGMTMLKFLINQITLLEKQYLKKNPDLPQQMTNTLIRNLRESVLLCAIESTHGIPEPEKWFHFLWTHVETCAGKFMAAKTKLYNSFFAPQLSVIAHKIILDLPALKKFAEYSARHTAATLREIFPEQPFAALRASPAHQSL
jgi:hypothetical protein